MVFLHIRANCEGNVEGDLNVFVTVSLKVVLNVILKITFMVCLMCFNIKLKRKETTERPIIEKSRKRPDKPRNPRTAGGRRGNGERQKSRKFYPNNSIFYESCC